MEPWSSQERYRVKHVATGKSPRFGTWALMSESRESFDSLMKVRAEMSEHYGCEPVSGRSVKARCGRWTWERPGQSDTLWVTEAY